MAHTKSSIKDLKRIKKRTTQNRGLKSKMRTSVKKARASIDEGADDANVRIKSAMVTLDKMVSKGIIHPNNAAKKKSRLVKRQARIIKGAAAPQAEPRKKVEKPVTETPELPENLA